MSLTTRSQLVTHLGLSSTAATREADFLDQLLQAVEAAFKKLTDRDIESTTYTSYLCGNDSKILLLPEYPVTSITSVHLDSDGYWGTGADAFASSTALTSGTHFALVKDGRNNSAEVGRLYRIDGVWPARWVGKQGLLAAARHPGAGNIKVVYTAGYVNIPDDIQLCLWQTCARLRSERLLGRPLQSETLVGDYTYSTMMDDALSHMRLGAAATVVATYKRIRHRQQVLG